MITASQIVTDACAVAKCPGFTALSGRNLNLVLQDLVLHRDLKMLRQVETINIQVGSNGPFLLPANYLRTYDLFYTVNNFPFFLNPLGQDEYDSLFKDPSVANYPEWYTTDLTAQQTQGQGSLFIWPQSTSSLGMTHRYMIAMPDIVTPESSSTIPWFQDQKYLVKATATMLMETTDDSRHDKFVTECEEMLRTHLIMGDGDEQKVVKNVRLDPRAFRFNRALRPTKTQPF